MKKEPFQGQNCNGNSSRKSSRLQHEESKLMPFIEGKLTQCVENGRSTKICESEFGKVFSSSRREPQTPVVRYLQP